MLLISEAIDRQGQTTPGAHRDQTVMARCTHQALESHGRIFSLGVLGIAGSARSGCSYTATSTQQLLASW
jgi:hypothetical protein